MGAAPRRIASIDRAGGGSSDSHGLTVLSDAYEETVRRAVALGGDCDTIAAIAGAAAEAAWGVPEELRAKVDGLLPIRLIELIRRFESVFAVSAPKRMPA